jgi:foldase protein PrsA
VRKPLVILLFLVAPALLLAGCGSAAPYAATVGSHRIAQSTLDDELEAIKSNKDYAGQIEASGTKLSGTGNETFDLAFTDQVLTRQIFYALAHQELVKRKLVPVKADTLTAAREQVVQQLGQGDADAGQKLFAKFPATYRDTLVRRQAEIAALSDALDRAYFDAHKADLVEVCASHILAGVKDPADPTGAKIDAAASKAKADQVAARLAKGDDFATVAKEMSDDTGSGAQGGDLGCQTPDQYVAEFAAATKTQPLNVLGAPVQTQFGYHFIIVKSRQPMSFEKFKQVVDQGQTIQPLNDFLRDAIAKTKLSVNPKFGTFDKKSQPPRIVPPSVPTTVKSSGATATTTTTTAP